MVFGRSINGKVFTFAPSGLLRQSNLVMWDRETESWWQQGTLEAIVGTMTGTRLNTIPSQVVSFIEFKAAFPQGTVLGGGAFASSAYSPYYGYDTSDTPFLFKDALDRRLPAMERVVGVQSAEDRVVQDVVGGKSIVLFYEPATLSTLDHTYISESRSVGTASVFVPRVGEMDLEFQFRNGVFVDRQTGSTWNTLGYAVGGPLEGQRLPPFFHTQSFWFYWAAIHKDTQVYSRSREG